MPNHVTNRVTVIGPKESIADFRKGCFGHIENETYPDRSVRFDFNKIVPVPAFISNDGITFGSREDITGRNWYNWNIESWGTKWNSYDLQFKCEEPERLVFMFDTAWSPPDPILDTLGRWFKELAITIEYFDEGNGFWGTDTKEIGSHLFIRKSYSPRDKSETSVSEFSRLQYELKGIEYVDTTASRKPSLCCDADTAKLQYPIWGFPKIDGVRIINLEGNATARSLMPHANVFTTQRFSQPIYRGIDGEGAMGDERSESLCRDTTSALNTEKGEPNIVWHAFDFLREDVVGLSYEHRFKALQHYVKTKKPDGVRVIQPTIIKNEAQLISFYKKCLAQGYEGSVFRDPMGLHKDGRCTANEANYMRMKPSSDKDALVLEVTEAQKNNNEKKTNALGQSERSSHKENKEGKGMIGTLICLDLETRQIINVGAGKMKHPDRIHFFNHPEEIVGQYIKYRSTDTGVKDAPRFGRFICIRSEEDTITAEGISSCFDKTPEGLVVGFHCEGGETFEYSGTGKLTLDTLDNNRPLFLSHDQHQWVPYHLDLKDYRQYKIIFEQPAKVMTYSSFNEYQNLYGWNSKDNRYVWSEELEKLFDQGYRLFVLGKNDKDELTEAFLICPKEYVKSIEEVPI